MGIARMGPIALETCSSRVPGNVFRPQNGMQISVNSLHLENPTQS